MKKKSGLFNRRAKKEKSTNDLLLDHYKTVDQNSLSDEDLQKAIVFLDAHSRRLKSEIGDQMIKNRKKSDRARNILFLGGSAGMATDITLLCLGIPLPVGTILTTVNGSLLPTILYGARLDAKYRKLVTPLGEARILCKVFKDTQTLRFQKKYRKLTYCPGKKPLSLAPIRKFKPA